ncbi:hypothetical protein TRIATDRAFT_90524 [Trichoderma atroviride IMI 206040]|uniref:Uncharacterized protein n=1 Tax=Hypocrea atroviridis (strain ATCC 20476 / IMI 206040) TaxID=452589 RepID=G9NG68_HYPAI|nr:uncharacterized protein TRIATDRAFT_90524 [Trichoderma atroviride IMI 206040]EHK50280.1 hypothetical protein TRIATDRAFT_90524 [Trichoderma atroviride IMI 206040]
MLGPSPKDDPEKNPLYYKIYNVTNTMDILRTECIKIRERSARFRYHKAVAKFKSILNKNIDSRRDDKIKAFLAGLETGNSKEGLPNSWKNTTEQREEGRPNEESQARLQLSPFHQARLSIKSLSTLQLPLSSELQALSTKTFAY